LIQPRLKVSQVALGDWPDYDGHFLLAFFLAQYAFIFADRLAFAFDAPCFLARLLLLCDSPCRRFIHLAR
jgi:hypothetical protein